MARRPRTIGPSASDPGFSPQHALELVRSAIPPVHPAGRPFVGAGLALALAGRRHRWLRRAACWRRGRARDSSGTRPGCRRPGPARSSRPPTARSA
ncbi:putative phosphatidylserine decarboxylase proenzyme [Mycobacterium sp. MAC_080597_8934]|nr:putative phosphatidylserine decarboxylase proenzyme [Mycobacterium sp. MAC_080597_8934]